MAQPTAQPEVAALLFDVLGTLVHDPFYREVPAFLGLSFEQLLADKHPTAWPRFERGSLTEAQAMTRFFRDGRRFDHQGLKAAMRQAYRWLDGMEPLVAELHRVGWRLELLSNYPVWYRLIEDKLRLSRFASWSLVSCRTGVRKPHREAYLNAARTLGLAPQHLLFIDDRRSNCEAARRVGIDAIQFHSATELRIELARRGIRGDDVAPPPAAAG